MRILYWHRNDLRVHDNTALIHTTQHQTLILYVLKSDEQTPFLTSSLQELQATYQQSSAQLHIHTGEPSEIITQLCAQHNIDEIHTQHIPAEETVLDNLPNIPIRTYQTYTLFRKQQLPKTFPENKQQFLLIMRQVYPPLAFAPPKDIESYQQETTTELINNTIDQESGEQEALRILEQVLENNKQPSALTKYLKHGLLSPRTAYYQAKDPLYKHKELITYLILRDYELFKTEISSSESTR